MLRTEVTWYEPDNPNGISPVFILSLPQYFCLNGLIVKLWAYPCHFYLEVIVSVIKLDNHTLCGPKPVVLNRVTEHRIIEHTVSPGSHTIQCKR